MADARSWTRIGVIVGAIVLAHVVVVTWFVVTSRDDTKRAQTTNAASTEPAPPPPPAIEPQRPMPMPALVANPSAVAVAPAATPSGSAPMVPEPLEELAAFFRPAPGAAEWTMEERRAYRQKLLDSLNRREKDLEAELRAAERAGDKPKAAQKKMTLDNLRSRREEIVAGIRERAEAGQ